MARCQPVVDDSAQSIQDCEVPIANHPLRGIKTVQSGGEGQRAPQGVRATAPRNNNTIRPVDDWPPTPSRQNNSRKQNFHKLRSDRNGWGANVCTLRTKLYVHDIIPLKRYIFKIILNHTGVRR